MQQKETFPLWGLRTTFVLDSMTDGVVIAILLGLPVVLTAGAFTTVALLIMIAAERLLA